MISMPVHRLARKGLPCGIGINVYQITQPISFLIFSIYVNNSVSIPQGKSSSSVRSWTGPSVTGQTSKERNLSGATNYRRMYALALLPLEGGEKKRGWWFFSCPFLLFLITPSRTPHTSGISDGYEW